MTESVASLTELAAMAAARLDEVTRSHVLVPLEVAEHLRAAQVRLDMTALVDAASEYYADVLELQQVHAAVVAQAEHDDPKICADLLARYEQLEERHHKLVGELRLTLSTAVELDNDGQWRDYAVQHLATALGNIVVIEEVLDTVTTSLREMAVLRT